MIKSNYFTLQFKGRQFTFTVSLLKANLSQRLTFGRKVIGLVLKGFWRMMGWGEKRATIGILRELIKNVNEIMNI